MYVGVPESTWDPYPSMPLTSIDVATGSNLPHFLSEMGFHLDYEFLAKGFIFTKGNLKVPQGQATRTFVVFIVSKLLFLCFPKGCFVLRGIISVQLFPTLNVLFRLYHVLCDLFVPRAKCSNFFTIGRSTQEYIMHMFHVCSTRSLVGVGFAQRSVRSWSVPYVSRVDVHIPGASVQRVPCVSRVDF